MSICSLPFLLFCGASVIVYQLAPRRLPRQIVLTLVNALFLIPLIPNQRSWGWFAVMLAATYLALVAVRARRHGAVVGIAVSLIAFLYLYLKRYTLVADVIPMPFDWDLEVHPVELVGLSYMTFKFVHMMVDQWQGQLAALNLWTYLSYQLSFFTLTAGPIQRYNDFRRCWDEVDLGSSESRETVLLWGRILKGMIKIGLLGALAHSTLREPSVTSRPDVADFLAYFYVYPIYLYFNFSGYTDVMIGVGGLLGFTLPENFNRPYLARNVLDWWDRWHISLSHWIRDYIFMGSYKAAATRFPSAARYFSYALLFVALFVAGVWHGATDGFVVFGALNGLGAALTRAYGDGLRGLLGRSGMHAYLQSRLVRLVARLLTLHYVCFCHLFFSNDVRHALALLSVAAATLGQLPGTFLSSTAPAQGFVLLGTAAIVIGALWKADAIGVITARLISSVVRRPTLLYTFVWIQMLIVVSVFFVGWALQQPPRPILYKAF
jgi:alginate O-acetyltransferase complex protein AlgI